MDAAGDSFITGSNRIQNFTENGTESLVAKLASTGTPVWSQRLSGLISKAITLDASGGVYVAGFTPSTVRPSCPCGRSAFVARFQDDTTVPLAILTSTTRWKPQRDTARDADGNALNPIKIEFASPSPLKSAIVTITGPSSVAPITAPFDPANPPNPYLITWAGFATDASGKVSYLNPGNYEIAIEGVKEDDTTIKTVTDDPNATVSLVEVTKVELCQADDSDGCFPLTTPYPNVSADNPPVGTLSGQDPPQERPGGGKRIFAEAATPAASINNHVKVRAITDPVIPANPSRPAEALTVPVYFKSLDADDPAPYAPDLDSDTPEKAPSDNRGSPKEGMIEQPIVNVTAGKTTAKSFFQTSLQPGDNYRVAASTSQEWLSGLQAVPSSPTGELAVTAEEKETNVSEMLTVWRTLHLELDSMAAAPTDDVPERNFLKGRALAIEGDGTKATKLRLAETTFVPLGLADRSPDLDRTSGVEGAGRFEKGTIRLGFDAAAVVITSLEGNGLNYVRKGAGMEIPFELRDAQGSNPVTGKVVGWDTTKLLFTVSATIPPNTYTSGKLRIGGVEWTVFSASGADVLVEDKDLPFFLVDDDVVTVPFAPNPGLLQASDAPTQNLLAQAYIRPAYDLANLRAEAPFNRNISTPRNPDGTEDLRDFYRQVEMGRDAAPSGSNAYWLGYAQSAYQADEVVDRDPGMEVDAALGWTIGDTSFVFAEVIAEEARAWARAFGGGDPVVQETLFHEALERCPAQVLAHEIGHHLGLPDSEPARKAERTGVMVMPCAATTLHFMADELATIRSKGVAK